MKEEKIKYAHGDVSLEAYVAYESSVQKKPCVLIAPDWRGRGSFAIEKAQYLASLGYVGFALDMYGEARVGINRDECSALMNSVAISRKNIQSRMLCGYNTAIKLPYVDINKMGVIGFCFGGLCAMDLTRSGVSLKASTIFHGYLNNSDELEQKPIKGKVVAFHGDLDPMVPKEQLREFEKEMTTKGAEWSLVVLGNTYHAFTNPVANDTACGTLYKKESADFAFNSMEHLFQNSFQ